MACQRAGSCTSTWMRSTHRSSNATTLSCAASRSSSAAAATAASSRRRATKCAVSACTRRCRRAKPCGVAPMRSACGRASGTTSAISQQVFAVFHEFTPLVQGLSLDEAFLDVTASMAALGPGAADRRGDQASHPRAHRAHGLGRRRARTSSSRRSPPTCASPTDSSSCRRTRSTRLLDPLPIRKLFGLGAKTAPKVEALGIHTLGELRRRTERTAATDLRPLRRAAAAARGRHRRPAGDRPTGTRSRSRAEETFDEDIADRDATARGTRSPGGPGLRASARDGSSRPVASPSRSAAAISRPTRGREHIEPRDAGDARRHGRRDGAARCLAATHSRARRCACSASASPSWHRRRSSICSRSTQTARNRELDGAVDRIREKFGRGSLTRGGVLQREPKPGASSRGTAHDARSGGAAITVRAAGAHLGAIAAARRAAGRSTTSRTPASSFADTVMSGHIGPARAGRRCRRQQRVRTAGTDRHRHDDGAESADRPRIRRRPRCRRRASHLRQALWIALAMAVLPLILRLGRRAGVRGGRHRPGDRADGSRLRAARSAGACPRCCWPRR